jgi:hypothetical protein
MKNDRKPRDVRAARRREWTVISPKGFKNNDVSWLGLMIWTDRNAMGKYVCSFNTCEFAFELEKDASWFALKWAF